MSQASRDQFHRTHRALKAFIEPIEEQVTIEAKEHQQQLNSAPLPTSAYVPHVGHDISYPTNYSEFEVQAWLYITLHKLGYDVRGEVSSRGARFDLIIFDTYHQPQLIIEVKSGRHAASKTQERRYQVYGVPLIYCYGPTDFRPFLKRLKALLPLL